MAEASSENKAGGALALAGVFIGAAGFAACLTCVYMGMRDVMINNGGQCASGGPYQINANQVCSSGDIWLLMGGIFVGLVFAGILIGASGKFGGWKLGGVGLLLWAALFGALGWNFIELGKNPPAGVSGGTGWIICGVVFWLMALGGLIPGLMGIASYFKDSTVPEEERPGLFNAPIVRANVDFKRSMPGDPMYGQTHVPNQPPGTATAGAAEQAPPREAQVDSGFIDPVTGEKLGGGSDG